MKKHGTANAVVRARINEKVKNQAAAVLEPMGLTVSDAFRLLLVKVAAEKTLPFEIHSPNAATIAAMKAGKRGETKKFKGVKELMADLNADD
ncbi:MAG TPA: type II toxin-antitoxin system RelB/DinJ family antitoxin [Acidobacteriaceae bacterium]|nr:type II toxin-antitoxin system RelB/DinJ family antitoxin [Acidobacteriaceae bacterium]